MSLCMVKIPVKTHNHSKRGCMAVLDSFRLILTLRSSRSVFIHKKKKKKLKITTNPSVYYLSGPITKKNLCANNASFHRIFADNFIGFCFVSFKA